MKYQEAFRKHVDPVVGGLNLDGLDIDALLDISAAIQINPEWAAEELFPGQQGNVEAVKTLCRYAQHKGEAMRLRSTGREAPGYAERACESLYAQLPGYANW